MIEGRLKTVIFEALYLSGALRVAGVLAKGVPILAWHGVTQRDERVPHNHRRLFVPAGLFERQLRLLRETCRPISLAEFVGFRAARRAPPRGAVVLTFDDGYRNVLTSALPLLRRYGIPVSLFVVTGRVGSRFALDALEPLLIGTALPALEWQGQRYPLGSLGERLRVARLMAPGLESLQDGLGGRLRELSAALEVAMPLAPDDDRDLLTWDEIRTLAAAGVDVGSHGHWHSRLPELAGSSLQLALAESYAALRTQLGAEPLALAYPYGAWDGRVAEAARRAGYACALTTDAGLNRTRHDSFSLRRLLVGADDAIPRFRASLVGLRKIGPDRRSKHS